MRGGDRWLADVYTPPPLSSPYTNFKAMQKQKQQKQVDTKPPRPRIAYNCSRPANGNTDTRLLKTRTADTM
jgi:hypothetical protein